MKNNLNIYGRNNLFILILTQPWMKKTLFNENV